KARVMPWAVASLVWQVVQDGVSMLPSVWVEFHSCEPRWTEKLVKEGSSCFAAAALVARIASRAELAKADPITVARQRAATTMCRPQGRTAECMVRSPLLRPAPRRH